MMIQYHKRLFCPTYRSRILLYVKRTTTTSEGLGPPFLWTQKPSGRSLNFNPFNNNSIVIFFVSLKMNLNISQWSIIKVYSLRHNTSHTFKGERKFLQKPLFLLPDIENGDHCCVKLVSEKFSRVKTLI